MSLADIALDALTDQVSFWRSGRGRNAEDRYVQRVSKDPGAPPHSQESMRGIIHASARALTRSDPIYVTAEVVALVDIARQSLPSTFLHAEDLLIQDGFATFAAPVKGLGDGYPLVGLSWTLARMSASGMPGTIVTSYITDGSAVGPNQTIPVPFAAPPEDYPIPPFVTFAVAFWRLAKQEFLVSRSEDAGRAARRRARATEVKTVTVITLRRGDRAEEGGTAEVDWTHRWLVRGHWRNQWYPKRQRHEPVWVAPYVKGPDSKPFVAKRRAFEFTR